MEESMCLPLTLTAKFQKSEYSKNGLPSLKLATCSCIVWANANYDVQCQNNPTINVTQTPVINLCVSDQCLNSTLPLTLKEDTERILLRLAL
mgnify:CR=1 FL=1